MLNIHGIQVQHSQLIDKLNSNYKTGDIIDLPVGSPF